MRNVARIKLGYYPLPPDEGSRLRQLLNFPTDPASVLDPCAGTGAALLQLTENANAIQTAYCCWRKLFSPLAVTMSRDRGRRFAFEFNGNMAYTYVYAIIEMEASPCKEQPKSS
jgi:hypothetical protein